MNSEIRQSAAADEFRESRLERANRTDEICDAFEQQLQAGQRPRIEDHVAGTTEPHRSELLHELLLLEIDFLRQHGGAYSRDEYCRRFPDQQAVLDTVLRRFPSGDSIATGEAAGGSDLHDAGDSISSASPGLTEGTRLGRLKIGEELGRGGMAVVHRAHDEELHRWLAVKTLLPKVLLPRSGESTDDHERRKLEASQRLRREAEITAGLSHPGVPPVHEVGELSDGRPYFCMRVVEGKTMAELLEESDDRSAHLKTFEQVAHILASAHEAGVIHRDLKPSNVMVGRHGEVQLMDWGMAKRVVTPGDGGAAKSEANQHDESRERDAGRSRAQDSSIDVRADATMQGAIMGTLAYMPPEQAQGLVDSLDQRADVFALGAVLCQVLTGMAPYRGSSAQELHRQASAAQLDAAFAALDATGTDAELLAIAKDCLAADPGARPANAVVVAERTRAYLESVEERLRVAEIQRAKADAEMRERRKRQRLWLTLAATVCVFTIVAASLFAWTFQVNEARQREQLLAQVRRTQSINDHVGEAERHLTALGKAPDQAQLRLGQAAAALRAAGSLLEGGPVDAAARVQYDQTTRELEAYRRDDDLVNKLVEARTAQSSTSVEKNRFDFSAAIPLYRQALTDYGLRLPEGDPLEAVSHVRRRPAWVQLAVVSACDDWLAVARSEGMTDASPVPWLREFVNGFDAQASDAGRELRVELRAIAEIEDASPRRERLEKLAATIDFVECSPAAAILLSDYLFAAGAADAGLALLEDAFRAYPTDFAIADRLASRQLSATEALRFRAAACVIRPTSAGAHLNYGNALSQLGKHEEAAKEYRTAIQHRSDYAGAYTNLGGELRKLGRREEAERALRKAVELAPEFAIAHINLASFLDAQGEFDEAIEHLESAARCEPDDGQSYVAQAIMLRKRGDYRTALEMIDAALAKPQTNGKAYLVKGKLLLLLGQLAEAEAILRETPAAPANLVGTCELLGVALRRQGRLHEAVQVFSQGLRANLGNDNNLRVNLATVLAELKRYPEARRALIDAMVVEPDAKDIRNNLGQVCLLEGDLEGAIREAKAALAIDAEYDMARQLLDKAERIQRLVQSAQNGKITVETSEEYLAAAEYHTLTKKYETASREYEVAFRLDKRLTENIDESHLVAAARCACLASESNDIDEAQKGRLRSKAVAWLLMELSMHRDRIETGSAEDRIDTIATMLYLKRDQDLAAVRKTASGDSVDLALNTSARLWQQVEQIIVDAQEALLVNHD